MGPWIGKKTNLLVEDPVALVDVCDVTIIFMQPLARSLAALIETIGPQYQIATYWTMSKTTYSRFIFDTTLSIASSLGLLSAYNKVLASRYRFSEASCC
jgi:hypothetical protein